ncbi:MAG: hypothetical protein ACK2UW_08970 [Anaerolineales bacterium]|jgi:hypothetical protein
MNIQAYFSAAAAGIPIVFPVIGLVWWYGKALKLKGSKQYASSLATGTVIGGLYMVTTTRPPAGDWWQVLGYWFGVGMYGLGLGLLASGLYDTGKDLFTRVVSQALGGIIAGLNKNTPAG